MNAVRLILLAPEVPNHDARRERLYERGARWIIESDLIVAGGLLLGVHPYSVRGGEIVGIVDHEDESADRLVALKSAAPQRVENADGAVWTMALCRFGEHRA